MTKRVCVIAGLAGALSALAAPVDAEPPLNYSTTTLDDVQRLYMCPDGLGNCPASDFCITVRNQYNNPINNAVVEILIAGQVGSNVGICPGSPSHSWRFFGK